MMRSMWIGFLLVTGVVGLLHGQAAPTTQATTPPTTQSMTDDVPVIAANEVDKIAAHAGKTVAIEGVAQAKWSDSGKVMNIYFKDVDRGVIGTIFERNKTKIDAAFNGDAAAAWTGAKIRITGRLSDYGGKVESMKGRQQIIIQNVEQVVVLEPAAK